MTAPKHRKVTTRTVARDVAAPTRVTPNAQIARGVDWALGAMAQEQMEMRLDPETAEAIELARDGDDSLLLPYQPTPSINPPRPRTLAAGYDSKTQTLRIRFRDGVGYEYYNVPPRVWRNFRRVKSPGRAINRVLNRYPYSRADW